ncbi:MAG TPA: hypothetical protein VK206_18640 [Anaerolineales bacterium]|nr:hypothetical protein [Anaerolineales bacterium]
MMIDLSHINWIWLIAGLIIVFVVFRFFSHIVAHVFHFIVSFFWHGCATVVVLLVVYFILRAFHIL